MSTAGALLLSAQETCASSFVFPAATPIITQMTTPAWLPAGTGDDGYVTVTVSVRMPDISCVPLGEKGFFSMGQEKLQVVASLKTVGFRTNLNGQSLPIATFDGRNNPGGCSSYNTLPAVIIPYARLEKFNPDSPPDLGILVEVRSTTNAESNLVGGATMALGAAAIFATGGAATTVAGLTAVLAKPALGALEQQYNADQSAIMLGSARSDFGWPTVRAGIKTMVIPMYVGKTKSGETPAEAIARLNANDLASMSPTDAKKLAEIVLSFSYSKTLFDPSIVGISDLPQGDAIARTTVLAYPKWAGVPNFLQLMATTEPSLLQTLGGAKGDALADACAKTLGILSDAGLNRTDRAIVMKAIIDEAKKSGDDWYKAANINSCFNSFPGVKATMLDIYGPAYQVVTMRDVQQGIGPEFQKWQAKVPPILADFRQVMMVKEHRLAALSTFNGQADLDFQLTADPSAWTLPANNTVTPTTVTPTSVTNDPAPVTAPQTAYPPGLTKLAAKGIIKGGCFAYNQATYLDPKQYGGHMVLVDEDGKLWHADISLSNKPTGKLGKVVLSPLDTAWKDFFKTNVADGGDCTTILSI